MIFAEYIEHDPGVPFQLFRHHGRQDWTGAGDVMVLNIGRTMRLAGEPFYMCWWQIKGIERVDEWEAHFRTPEGRLYMADTPVSRALRFTRNGLYDVLLGEGAVPDGLHLLEHFSPDGLSEAAIRQAFAARAAAAAPAGRLLYVVRRLNRLGPEPGGMALWTFASYAQAEPFLRAPVAGGVAVTAAGLYRNFGAEIP